MLNKITYLLTYLQCHAVAVIWRSMCLSVINIMSKLSQISVHIILIIFLSHVSIHQYAHHDIVLPFCL